MHGWQPKRRADFKVLNWPSGSFLQFIDFSLRIIFAQRGCGPSVPGGVPGQAGWDSEQPGLVEGVPVHGRGVETGFLKDPNQS